MDSFLPGSASLLDLADKYVMVALRDGRFLVGFLRSYDQFANVVLESTIERVYCQKPLIPDSVSLGDNKFVYGEKKLGVFVIRGENVAWLGEVDEKQCKSYFETSGMKMDFDAIRGWITEDQNLAKKQKEDLLRTKMEHEMGFFVMNVDEY